MLDSYGGESTRDLTERSQIVGCHVSCNMQCIAVCCTSVPQLLS